MWVLNKLRNIWQKTFKMHFSYKNYHTIIESLHKCVLCGPDDVGMLFMQVMSRRLTEKMPSLKAKFAQFTDAYIRRKAFQFIVFKCGLALDNYPLGRMMLVIVIQSALDMLRLTCTERHINTGGWTKPYRKEINLCCCFNYRCTNYVMDELSIKHTVK